MKKIFAFFGILFIGSVAFCDVAQLRQFGGLNTDESPLLLQNQTPDSENVVTDDSLGLQGRKGFISFSTTPAKAIWEFSHSNGTKYIIIHDNVTNTLKASTGGGSFTTLISTVASGLTTCGSALGDRFYFSNTTDGLKYWDTATVTVADADKKFTCLVTHAGRLWGIGVPTTARTIYASAFGDGTDWTLDAEPADDSPAQFVCGGANDEVLSALKMFRGSLVWFKARSFGAILGTDRSDFENRVYSEETGTAYKDTVQDCGGILRWLGPLRTVWEFDGSGIAKISEDIDTLMAQVSQGDASARSYSVTSKIDFDAGTNYNTANTIVSGDVYLSTFGVTDTLNADFNLGTKTNVSIYNDRIYLSTNNVEIPGYDFTGDLSTNWVLNSISRVETNILYDTNKSANGHVFFRVLDKDGATLDEAEWSTAFRVSPSDENSNFNLSNYVGRFIKIQFEILEDGESFTSLNPFLCSGEPSFHVAWKWGSYFGYEVNVGGGIGSPYGQSTITSGSFLSKSFDTGISSPTWLTSTVNATPNGHNISFQTQVSDNGTDWDALVAWTTTTAPASANKRYIRYKVNFSTASTGTGLPYVSDVQLSARSKQGTWVSSNFSLGSLSAFSTFGKSDTTSSGGVITYALYTDSDTTKTVTNGVPVVGTYVSSQTITDSQIPSLSTAAYAFFGSSFSIDAATQTPSLQSLTLNWNEGALSPAPSGFIEQRYWIGVAKNSSTNNKILVYDKKRQWQQYSGINANAIAIYNGRHYFGNSSGVFLLNSGYSDAGSDIISYYKSSQFAPAGWNTYSTFNELWATTENSASTLSTTYQMNGDTSTDYALGSIVMNATAGNQTRKIPFPISQINQSKSIDLKFSVTGSAFWRIMGFDLDYTIDPTPVE